MLSRISFSFRRSWVALAGVLAALTLAACGGPPQVASWPGLAADDTRAYVSSGYHIYAVDLTNGRETWRFPPAGNNNEVFAADPVVTGDLIIAGSEGPISTFSGVMFGLNRADGALRWCLAFDDAGAQRWGNCQRAPNNAQVIVAGISLRSDDRVLGGVAVDGNEAFFGLANNLGYAIDVKTGAYLWSFKAQHPIWATPLVISDTVYFVSLDHNIYARDRQTGAERWTRSLGASIGGTPVLKDGVLYVGTFANELHAINAANGESLWEKPFVTSGWIWGGPVYQAGRLYFTDLSGTVYVVDAQTSTPVWQTVPGGRVRISPLVVDETLLVSDKDGQVFALNLANGAPIWNTTVRGQLLSNPVYAATANLVLVAPHLGDNMLVALTPDGVQRWAFQPSR